MSLVVISLLNGENVELFLVSEQISSWYWAAIAYRIFSFLAIYMAFATAGGSKNRLIKSTLFIFTFISLIDVVLYFAKDSSYGGLIISKPNEALVITLVVLLLISSFGIFVDNKRHKVKPWLYIILLAPTMGVSFIRIIYADDFMYRTTTKNEVNFSQLKKTLKNYNEEVAENDLLIPFFSTSCSHCKSSAQKLSISHDLNLLPKTVIAFASDSSSVIKFMNTYGLDDVPYVILPIEELLNISGIRLPSIFHFSNGKSAQYIGEQFNNLALSKIAESVKK